MILNELLAACDVHVAGETFRLIDGRKLPPLQPLHLKRLLEEPRGHRGMRLCIILPSEIPEADARLDFLDAYGNTAFVEHGLIAVATLLAELYGMPKRRYGFEHGGKIYTVDMDYNAINEEVVTVAYTQPLGKKLTSEAFPPGFADVFEDQTCIAVVDIAPFHLHLTNHDLHAIKKLSVQWFTERKEDAAKSVKRLVFFEKSDDGFYTYMTWDEFGRVDRSPYLGAAVFSGFLYHNGSIKCQEPYELVNFLGHRVEGVITRSPNGLQVTVKGKGMVIATHQFFIDPNDPLKDGFLLKE